MQPISNDSNKTIIQLLTSLLLVIITTKAMPIADTTAADCLCVATDWHLTQWCPASDHSCVQAKNAWCESVACDAAYSQYCECSTDSTLTPTTNPTASPTTQEATDDECCVATAWHLETYCPTSGTCIAEKNDWCATTLCDQAYTGYCERRPCSPLTGSPTDTDPVPTTAAPTAATTAAPTAATTAAPTAATTAAPTAATTAAPTTATTAAPTAATTAAPTTATTAAPTTATTAAPTTATTAAPTAAPTAATTAAPTAATTAAPTTSVSTFVRHGYIENWLSIDTASLKDLTAVFYAFLTLDQTPQWWEPREAQWDGNAIYESMTGADVLDVMSGDPSHSWHRSKIDEVLTYCALNSKKFIWALGGWSDLTLTIGDSQVNSLVEKIVALLQIAGDGIDLDFEHLSEHTGDVLTQQRLVVGKLVVALKSAFAANGLQDKLIVYTPRYNAFWKDGAHGSTQLATDGEGLDVVNYITAHSDFGVDALDFVNLMMYDIDAKEAFSSATESWFVQSQYDAVVAATSAAVGLSKTVIGFEPRLPQAYTGIWAGLEKDKLSIQHISNLGVGGAMWWAMNDQQLSYGQSCGENAVELAAFSANLA